MRKKFVAGAAILALLMNSPQVSADNDIIVFGGEFEDESPAPSNVEKPEPRRELPTKPPENPAPEVVEPPENPPPQERPSDELDNLPPRQPVENEPSQPQPVNPPPQERPSDELDNLPPRQPVENEPSQPQPVNPPPQERPSDELDNLPPRQPVENEPSQPQPVNPPPQERPSGELDNLPPRQPVENEPSQPQPVNQLPTETDRPFTSPSEIAGNSETVTEPPPALSPVEQPRSPRVSNVERNQPRENLRTLRPRFIKLAVDETYTYYLDKSSVQWKKMPYSASEYIADVWIRMIERQPQALDSNMASYGADNFNAEIAFAREQGYQYPPEDLQVLQSQAYVLEHYYLRPKTKQIQFLCELEVFGRPQNTINERAYDYQNWENLVPGSVESLIYAATIKVIGKSKSSERGHMTFFDMLDEYARIALN